MFRSASARSGEARFGWSGDARFSIYRVHIWISLNWGGNWLLATATCLARYRNFPTSAARWGSMLRSMPIPISIPTRQYEQYRNRNAGTRTDLNVWRAARLG